MSNIMHMLESGEEVVSMDDLYGGSNRYFRLVAHKSGLKVHLVDCTNLDSVKAVLNDKTRLVWIETPTNPMLKVVDIEAVSKVIKEFNKDIIIVVDNTFMSSYFQRPLDLGADIVHHSLTKYMNGHTDVVQGCAVLRDEELYKRLKFLQNSMGMLLLQWQTYFCKEDFGYSYGRRGYIVPCRPHGGSVRYAVRGPMFDSWVRSYNSI